MKALLIYSDGALSVRDVIDSDPYTLHIPIHLPLHPYDASRDQLRDEIVAVRRFHYRGRTKSYTIYEED